MRGWLISLIPFFLTLFSGFCSLDLFFFIYSNDAFIAPDALLPSVNHHAQDPLVPFLQIPALFPPLVPRILLPSNLHRAPQRNGSGPHRRGADSVQPGFQIPSSDRD